MFCPPVSSRHPRMTLTVQDHNAQPSLSPPHSKTTKSSLDIPQLLERKLAQYNASSNIFKCWLFEIISVSISAICMGIIIGILHILDNRSLTTWPIGLTIITILSKIASAALIIPISEAIGQLKWTWFQGKKSKDAFDFEIFDKASRGAWGSVLLLMRTRGRSLAALGAFLTVLLLAIDTFFQQVTDLPERWILKDESFIPRTIRYTPDTELAYDSSLGDVPITQMNRNLHKALTPFYYDQNGSHPLTTAGNNSQAEFSLSCPTSKCEWDSYETLGVCSACEEVSHLLEYACLNMSMDWILSSTGPSTESTYPNGTACGYFLNATSKAPVLMSGYRVNNASNSTFGETLLMRTLPLVTNPMRQPLYGGSINYKHIQNPIIDAIIVSAADGSADSVYRKEIPVAHECMLSWCVKTLRSSYLWGGYHEELVEALMNTTTNTEFPWHSTFVPESNSTDQEFLQDVSIYPSSMEQNGLGFGVSNLTFFETVIVLDEIFPSLLTVANASAKPYLKIRTSATDKVMYRAVRFNPWVAPNNVSHHMERMAEAITNVVRSDPNSNELVVGKAYALETFVAVNWAWLTFPIAMLFLSIIFLAATIFKTARQTSDNVGMWKTSAMPSLSYSLSSDTPVKLASSSGGVEKVRIRLLPNQGWRISRDMHNHEHVQTKDQNNISNPRKQLHQP